MATKATASQDSAKIPPQNLDAEKSLLGAILISDNIIADVVASITPEDFYETKHQLIFAAMLALYETNRPIDLLTLTTQLKAHKNLDKAGGSTYLTSLTNYISSAAHATAYADLVSAASTRRRLITTATSITEMAYEDDTDMTVLLDEAEKELFSVSGKVVKTDAVSMEDILTDTFDRLEELSKNKGALRGLKTGFHDLDRMTAGFQKSDLIIIGARPAMGKTTFAQNLLYNVASINKSPVLFFSLEMSKAQITDRMLSDVSGVKSWNIRTGDLSGDDFAKIADAMAEMSDLPIYIDDSSAMSIMEMRTKARRAQHDHKISMIIVDYLQLMSGSPASIRSGNRVQEVSEISRGLKQMARELDIPVIALAQLSRAVTGRDDPRPVLSDLKESGSIEQDADMCIFIHRPDYYKQNKPDFVPTNITELLIQKHRNGPVGKVDLYFNSEILRFQSLDKERTEP